MAAWRQIGVGRVEMNERRYPCSRPLAPIPDSSGDSGCQRGHPGIHPQMQSTEGRRGLVNACARRVHALGSAPVQTREPKGVPQRVALEMTRLALIVLHGQLDAHRRGPCSSSTRPANPDCVTISPPWRSKATVRA